MATNPRERGGDLLKLLLAADAALLSAKTSGRDRISTNCDGAPAKEDKECRSAQEARSAGRPGRLNLLRSKGR
ncbi:hypothetical protein [Actinocrispum wychmicini]|nr:hypothetical protein [Actinocrispum wychmicini]